MHRYTGSHHSSSSRSLPKVWLQGGVLALPFADTAWLPPRDHLCNLCHHQINQFQFILSVCRA
ncbi:hypothetical protein ZIOFF_040999 [Zingiber officinale]|uniref:Uncharacterized protein n=1 Tax=Zingiber officinale TaxID=94328 RepID=A0A8J5L510_ZINOF|nr:hypothetical protein ZIOFF_040999 [Zingiber officinale]